MKFRHSICLAGGDNGNLLLAVALTFMLTFIQVSVSSAAPGMLNNGRQIDIPADRLQAVKDSPGIFFFPYRPEDIFKHGIREWIIIKLSDELGGGFLAGTAENMKRALSAAGVSIETSVSADLQQPPVPVGNRIKEYPSKTVEIEMGYGYRQDDMDWNVAGDIHGENPTILSELTWKNLLIHEFRLGIRADLKNSFYLKGSINYGVIVEGENQDSDFAEDNRQMEFSRSNNDAGRGSTLDSLIGAGYRLRLFSKSLSVIPLAGYSYHRQNLTMTDGYQSITWTGGPSLGSFDGLDSSYDAEWWGPWAGIDLILEMERFTKTPAPVSLYAGYAYHWATYYAEADWNLRDDFQHPKSFEHEADGTGMVVNLGIRIHLYDRCSLTFGYETETWSTEEGTDRVFLTDGTVSETRLNEVNRHTEIFLMGFLIRF